MKKLLFASVAMVAFAPSAFAQINASVYGVADAGLAYHRSDVDRHRVTLESGMASGDSHLGFRGSEKLSGGLTAIFQLENGFGIDTGAAKQGGRIFGRQAWVGLQGDFGTLRLGRQWTPLFLAVDAIDPFNNVLAGDATYWLGSNIFAIDLRMDNAVSYAISAGPLLGEVAYAFGEVPGDSDAKRQIGGRLSYQQGALGLVLGHHTDNDATGTGAAKASVAGATYAAGPVTAHIGYSIGKNTAAGLTAYDNRTGLVGITIRAGAGKVMASYIRSDDRTRADRDANQLALGYIHSLSKRTSLYTSYAHVNVNDVQKLNVGIRHSF